MAPSTEEFASELAREIRARRSFGGNPFWHRVEEGAVSRPTPQTFAEQFHDGIARAVDGQEGSDG
jgi:hypothetical protein